VGFWRALATFEIFWHDAGAGLGKGAIPMRSDTSRLPLVLAALVGGLALFVAGFFIAAEMRSAAASPAAAVTASGCYTNWNANTCSPGYTAVETGVWTTAGDGAGVAAGFICAAEKAQDSGYGYYVNAITRYYPVLAHRMDQEPCATCCAVTTSSVGGIGELPPIAGIDGSPAHNYAIAAVLAFVAVVAFAAGGWYAKRRWLG
jgi:hypothetical protein